MAHTVLAHALRPTRDALHRSVSRHGRSRPPREPPNPRTPPTVALQARQRGLRPLYGRASHMSLLPVASHTVQPKESLKHGELRPPHRRHRSPTPNHLTADFLRSCVSYTNPVHMGRLWRPLRVERAQARCRIRRFSSVDVRRQTPHRSSRADFPGSWHINTLRRHWT